MAGAFPLLGGDGEHVARRDGAPITRAALLGEIEALADWLPDHSFVVNLCTDRVRFAVALAAAMLRGQVTLLPADGSAAAVTALLDQYRMLYALTDRDAPDGLPCLTLSYPQLAPASSNRVPAFLPEQVAAVLFTSGSTGKPQPSARSWGRLVAASRAAGAALGIGSHVGAPLVATVPHAHSYGLESAVMLPLQHGLLLDAGRPFFPADVAAALSSTTGPGVLVTTPVHLRALVGEQGTGCDAAAGLVVSATAPLIQTLATAAEGMFAAPVFEIYGCSEAGQLATRRTAEGPVWRCLEGFRLRREGLSVLVSGPAERDVALADELELRDADHFVLLGRTADQVNIAGKRSSLAYLTQQLLAIEGVTDGVFVAPDHAASPGTQRLAAFAVAPGLDARAILAALRTMIDPAFLPRPLQIVDALPRNPLGKLPRPQLLRMLGLADAPMRLDFAADHPAGPGHFPGNPIIPGAVLLDRLLPMLSGSAKPAGGISSVKFHQVVRPGDSVVVTTKDDGATIRFEGRIAGSDLLVVSGAARATSRSR